MMSYLAAVILEAADRSWLIQELWLNVSAHYNLWSSVDNLWLIDRLTTILHAGRAQTSHFQRRMRRLASTSGHRCGRKDLTMLINNLWHSLLLLHDLQAMLMLSHLLIHFPLLDIFLSNLTRIVMWLMNDSLNDGVLHFCLSFQLLLVRGLSTLSAAGVDIL